MSDKKNLKGAGRIIQNNLKKKSMIFKRDGSLKLFFHGYEIDLMCSVFLTCRTFETDETISLRKMHNNSVFFENHLFGH